MMPTYKQMKDKRLQELRVQAELLQRIVNRLPVGGEMYLAVHGALDETRQEQDKVFYRKEDT